MRWMRRGRGRGDLETPGGGGWRRARLVEIQVACGENWERIERSVREGEREEMRERKKKMVKGKKRRERG